MFSIENFGLTGTRGHIINIVITPAGREFAYLPKGQIIDITGDELANYAIIVHNNAHACSRDKVESHFTSDRYSTGDSEFESNRGLPYTTFSGHIEEIIVSNSRLPSRFRDRHRF